MKNNTIYPDLPAIAKHHGVEIDDIENYQVWYSCFFVKIAKVGWRFVSRAFTRIKVAVKRFQNSDIRFQSTTYPRRSVELRSLTNGSTKEGASHHRLDSVPKETLKSEVCNLKSLYRVLKTWDNGSSWYGDRVISVLVQNTNNREKPWWSSVFLAQGIHRGDILRFGSGDRFVKTDLDYGQAVGLY